MARAASLRLALGRAAVCGLLVAAPRAALANDAQVFELGKNRFDKGLYEDAERSFLRMLDAANPTCPPDTKMPTDPCRLSDAAWIERAREMLAATYIALKKPEEADKHIEALLVANPTYVADRDQLPIELVDRVTLVRARIRDKLADEVKRIAEEKRKKALEEQAKKEAEAARVRELERMAGEVVVEGSRGLAMVPFGVGQFQNGDTGLGVFFAVSEAVTAGLSVALAAAWVGTWSNAKTPDANGSLDAIEIANQVSFATFAALAVGGVVQAQVAFVPRRVVPGKRTLPKPVSVVPAPLPLPGGAGLGVVGSF